MFWRRACVTTLLTEGSRDRPAQGTCRASAGTVFPHQLLYYGRRMPVPPPVPDRQVGQQPLDRSPSSAFRSKPRRAETICAR